MNTTANTTANTSYAAVIGHPIGHSLSPVLHNRIYQMLDLDIFYMAFDIVEENFEKGIDGLAALNFLGFNVTIPYKEKIIDSLDELDPMAAAIGAVNTVKVENGRLIGYNTDGIGFLNSLKMNNVVCDGKRILIIGAGGAARAIGISLVQENPRKILILNRNRNRGVQLSRDINEFANRNISDFVEHPKEKVDIIINTTSVGMWPKIDESPLKGYLFRSSNIVCDIVYNPSKTLLLQQAENFGCKTVGGIGMLVGQGVKAIEIWTGVRVDKKVVESVTKELQDKL